MKAVLVLQHVPHEMLGTVGPALTAAGLDYRYINLHDAVPERLDLARAAGLVVLGGPMNVDQTDRYPFLAPEVAWIRQAVEAELPRARHLPWGATPGQGPGLARVRQPAARKSAGIAWT